mmetsp:Transcript_48468/g.156029  ORF Transcript_48468/g.156029 Transcript_48468/m.156029 type:complete len:211 (-) Transcript_48468:314-946(-)
MSWAARAAAAATKQAAPAPAPKPNKATAAAVTAGKAEADTSDGAAESAPPAATTSASSAPSRVDQRPKEWSYGVFCRSVHSTIHDAAKLSPFFAQFGEVKSISCRDHGNAMVTFTSQAAASFALKSFEEKPDIFNLEGKPVRIEELKTFTERYPGGAPAGPRAGRAGGRGAEGRGEGRGSKGRGRGDGSRPPRSRSEASGDGGGKAAAAK